MIAALFIHPDGPYAGHPDVDAWCEARDAREYDGPHPVIAHPPCERWGKFAKNVGMLAQDGGAFEAALKAVRRFGGVLEHPEGSKAFHLFDLPIPKGTGWSKADKYGGRSCLVYQGHYGHRAPKATWLYAVRTEYPELVWGPLPPRDLSHLDEAARKRAIKTGICQRLSRKQRMLTPPSFALLLKSIAETAGKS